MAEANIPISDGTRARLEEMASWAGISIAEALERAVNEHYDRRFWEAVNAGYAALRADAAAWAEIESERRLWENTLLDGLDPCERSAGEGDASPAPSEQPS
jgi:hypothetical protein